MGRAYCSPAHGRRLSGLSLRGPVGFFSSCTGHGYGLNGMYIVATARYKVYGTIGIIIRRRIHILCTCQHHDVAQPIGRRGGKNRDLRDGRTPLSGRATASRA